MVVVNANVSNVSTIERIFIDTPPKSAVMVTRQNRCPESKKMNTPEAMNESDFHARVDALLAELEDAIDEVDADIDTEATAGILTLTFANATKVIINRQTATREVWVAAQSGGFHFRFDGAAWRDTRSNEQLDLLLSRVISMQSGCVVAVSLS